MRSGWCVREMRRGSASSKRQLTVLAISQLVQTFRVDGTSMAPGLNEGQFLLIKKRAYLHVDGTPLDGWVPGAWQASVKYLFGGPQRGDVVVFRLPTERDKTLVKRVIGLPGDEVIIKNGDLVVNGAPLKEPYVNVPWPNTNSYLLIDPLIGLRQINGHLWEVVGRSLG
jgi:signal peptidase I